jgi:hypothetical protein
MPASKHRRHGRKRPRVRHREEGEYQLSPEMTGELELLHQVLRKRYGDHEPTETEMADALTSLSGRLPITDRLLHELEHNDPDGTMARVLMAAVHT